MLEMMPGSIVDKTNNNLSNLACAHSTIEKKRESGKENMMEVRESTTGVSVSLEEISDFEESKCDSTLDETSECSLEAADSVQSFECNFITQKTFETSDIVREISRNTVVNKTNETIDSEVRGSTEININLDKTVDNTLSHEIDVFYDTSEGDETNETSESCTNSNQADDLKETIDPTVLSTKHTKSIQETIENVNAQFNVTFDEKITSNMPPEELVTCNVITEDKTACILEDITLHNIVSEETDSNQLIESYVQEKADQTIKHINLNKNTDERRTIDAEISDVPETTNENNAYYDRNVSQETSEPNNVSEAERETIEAQETINSSEIAPQKTSKCVIFPEEKIECNAKEIIDYRLDTDETSGCNLRDDLEDLEKIVKEIMDCDVNVEATIDDNRKESMDCDVDEGETMDFNVDLEEKMDCDINVQETTNGNLKETIKNILLETTDCATGLEEISGGKEALQIEEGSNMNLEDSETKLEAMKSYNSKKERKLNAFLDKHKVTIEDLIPKIKNFKRLSKDKRRPYCVLSSKLNRYYFKSIKSIRSDRISYESKKLVNTYIKNKKQPTKVETNESTSTSSPLFPDFNSDEDIRDKIKKQLELLRKNKQIVPKKTEQSEHEETISIPEKVKPVETDNVLLNNGESGLSIVSVVGGYFSDEEQETQNIDTQEKLNRGISMTDILLQRDFSATDSSVIKLTKTDDVRKIKGWKTKYFAAASTEKAADLIPNNLEGKHSCNKSSNTIDHPIASTSSGYNDPKQQIKPDNILKQGENLDQSTKSAFVSDVLDTFLNKHSELKISYEVPKLVAEENITQPKTEMPVSSNDYLTVVNKTYRKRSTNKVFKPKTLAEKRRMLEKDRQNQLLHEMETNENVYLKQLEYCEKRNRYEVAKEIRESLISKNVPFSRYCWNVATSTDRNVRQFVVFNGNKIRILGSAGGDDITVNQQDKLHRKIAYKPGPLSKKHKLIKNDRWECRVLKMPKIKLVVCPELGKRLPMVAEQYIQLSRGEQGFISNELAKFAVSAVRTQKPTKNKFEFDIPYKNGQNKLLVRKQRYYITSHDRKKPKKFVNVEDSIKSVMSDMLDCIENQNLDKFIIKDDPDVILLNDRKDNGRPPSPINPMIQSIIKRPNLKRSRTTLELRRLNVKIIEVDVKEEQNSEEICSNDFCRLGCVCKSLRGAASLVPEHCGRANCMLECSCTFENASRGTHSITLPAGTDILSASTVVRLQDEVKRNLAKEEKEFTQTVIKTNNQTIMVGGGTRERSKRVSKVPKKYSNFVQKIKGLSYEKMNQGHDDDDFESQVSKSAIQKAKEDVKKVAELPQPVLEVKLKKPIPIWKKEREQKLSQVKNCQVSLTKLKLDNVAPWCMLHNLYKCHCGGNAVCETPSKQKEKPKEELNTENEYISYPSRYQARIIPEINQTPIDISEKYCARTKALPSNFYQLRNKSLNFKARHNILKTQKNVALLTAEDIKNNIDITDHDQEIKPASNNPSSPKNPCHVVSAASFIDYDRSFIGLLTPSSEWLEKFHKMLNLNMNTVIRQIRLLEWATLVQRQKAGILQLWFNNKKYNNIILTEDKKRPTKSHVNISYFEKNPLSIKTFRLPEIITSLFKNKLPGVATKDTETYVILVYNGISWEARGTIVLNDTSEMCRQRLGHKKVPIFILNPVLDYQKNKPENKSKPSSPVVPIPNIVIKSTPAISVEVVTNNKPESINKTNEIGLEITKIPQQIEQKKEEAILAPLPTGFGLNHWFMLILKNDFSVLRISFSNFHIKYTHLMTAIQTAQRNKKTVRIRSQDKHGDNKNNFGVYALPGFSDRIFFGPYQDQSDHGLETFRYVNGKLVNTKIYNKMRGNVDKNTTGIWYFHVSTVQNNLILEPQTDTNSSESDCSTEVTSAEKAIKPQIEFVDLTENDSDTDQPNTNQESQNSVDALFNVLSADFTKKVSEDITIEPVYNNHKTPFTTVKQNDIVIQPITDDQAKLTTLFSPETKDRKRKSFPDSSQEPPKKQPTLIDSIELDDDDDDVDSIFTEHRKNNTLIVKKVPDLCPIKSLNQEVLKKRKVVYVITNIPGIGYFEIFSTEKKCLRLDINGKATMFSTISMALTWLHQLFRKFILFMPSTLKVKFSILESTEKPDMPKFNQNYLNGYHVMCDKGIFDLIQMTAQDMEKLGFSEADSSTLLSHKSEILIDRNVRILGSYLVGPEEASKLDKSRILHIAPKKIRLMESREDYLKKQKSKLKAEQTEMIHRINNFLKDIPEQLRAVVEEKVHSILENKSNALPVGKVQIKDGKINIIDSPKSQTNYEMVVPITGLQTPVTVVGVSRKQSATSLLLPNLKKSPQKVVDLTED